MSLRSKLIASFVGVTLLMGLSGVIGLLFIESINDTLNNITDVAAPTVETSDDLIAGIWEATTIVETIHVSENPAEIQALRSKLLAKTGRFDSSYAELCELVDDASLLDDLESANAEQLQFVEHSNQAIEQQLLMLAKEAESKRLLQRFDAVGARLTGMLDEFAIENEEEMRRAEEEGDRLLASGNATAHQVNELLGELFEKDYPVVEASLKLQRLIFELQEVCGEFLAQEELSELEPMRQEFKSLFTQADGLISTLDELAETEEDRRDTNELSALVSQWDDTVLTDDGLFDSHQDMLIAELEVDRLGSMLRSDAEAAATALNTVANHADNISDNADELAATTVANAKLAVGITIATGVLLALVLGISITRAVTRPVAELVETVGDVQATGNLELRSTITSSDEIGVMARAMNDFLSSLETQAQTIDDISLGKLDVSVEPASDRDVLAISVNRMIETLREVSHQADKISSGDYSTQISPRCEQDKLGVALQRMTATLRDNAADACLREWTRKSQGLIHEATRGVLQLHELGERVIVALSEILEAQRGAFYLFDEDTRSLRYIAGYAAGGEREDCPDFQLGEGLVGQAARDRKPIRVDQVTEDYYPIRSGLGEVTPRSLFVYPLVHDDSILGAIEFASTTPFDERQAGFLPTVVENLSIAVRAARTLEERMRAEEALRLARNEAQSANQAKDAFLANMSHELRTPMNAILGYSEMLMEDAEESGQDEAVADLKKIHLSASHLLSLINDVLDLAKVGAGKMEIHAESFEVNALIDEVIATTEPLLLKNDNRLVIERGEHVGSAYQDVTKLRQSLLNLVSNAAKFTKSGTVTVRAERETQGGTEWLILSVSDSGIGIPADKIDRVFEEFGQADESTTRDYGGTGLGLPITKRFCQMLHGDVFVESEPGKGSTFTIRVPANLPEKPVESSEEAEPKLSETELAELHGGHAGRTVLVIDDDPQARELMERLLVKSGFEVVLAPGGEEGLRLAHVIHPAVITLDVMMPDMDGWSVLRALKADPGLRDVPVVMLSIVDDKSKGYSLGATDYLTKPVDADRLREVLGRYRDPDESGSILVVDDDADVREMMTRAIEKAGWRVTTAEHGRAALAHLEQHRPTLVVLDLMMPVMDGFDFLIELHAHPEWREIPVVVLTSKDLTDADRRLLGGRVEEIVEKGAWSHERVVSLVEKLAEGRGVA